MGRFNQDEVDISSQFRLVQEVFWNQLNGSETMNVLAMKGPGGTKEVAQLWVIGKLEYSTLVVNQFPSYTFILCLSNDDRATLHLMFKKWGNLGKDWDPSFIDAVINLSTRPEKGTGIH